MLAGIDVSRWQVVTPFLGGLAFLFARASIGTAQDGRYAQHAGRARAGGLIVGAYHFGLKADGAAQARAFLAAAGAADLFVLDLEGRDPMTDDQARAFIATVQAAGHKCGLYHSDSGFPDLGQDWHWVANWSRSPTRPWTFWQYRGSPLDLDRYAGSIDGLRALAGRPPVEAPTVWAPEVPADIRALDPPGRSVATSVARTGHDYGGLVGMPDLAAAMERARLDYGSVVNPGDVRRLLKWRPLP